jgi:hypothetical protein
MAFPGVGWFDMTPLAGNPGRGVNPDMPLVGLLLVSCFLRPRGLVNQSSGSGGGRGWVWLL